MSSKMERFTTDARRVLSLAQEETVNLGHSFIEPEHILLGITGLQDSPLLPILSNYGISSETLLTFLQARFIQTDSSPISNPDLSNEVKKILELSVDEARRQGHFCITSCHFLVALLRLNHQNIEAIFEHFHVNKDDLRKSAREYAIIEIQDFLLYKKISKICWDILATAQEIANEFGHASTEIYHLFLALVRVKDTTAEAILAENDIIEAKLIPLYQSQFPSKLANPADMKPEFSLDVKKCLQLAADEVDRMRATEIDSGHLLYGLLRLKSPEMEIIYNHFQLDRDKLLRELRSIPIKPRKKTKRTKKDEAQGCFAFLEQNFQAFFGKKKNNE